jgi:cohesin loading factor subunit SCC2
VFRCWSPQGYCSSAMSLALLLRLKRHLKIVYNLNDARCQAFQPNEAIKPGDMLTKRETKEFSTKELPIETPITVRQMLQQYQVTICSLLLFTILCLL